MAKNLTEKIYILLNDIKSLNEFESAKRIEAFVKAELDWQHAEHALDDYDLEMIKSVAVKHMTDYPVNELRARGFDYNQDRLRTLSYLEGCIALLRTKGLIPFTVTHKKRK